MAFCTNCGSNMDANAHFCPKCGKPVTSAAASPTAAAAAPAQTYTPPAQGYAPPAQSYNPQAQPASGGGGIGKALLIIGLVLLVIFVFFVGGAIFVAHRVKNRMRNGFYVTENGKNSVVETPFGRASASTGDAAKIAHEVGIDLYPGATPGESSTAQFGKMTTATIKLTTGDPVDKVADFYKSRFSNAMTSTDNGKFTLVGNDKDGTVTITVEPDGSATKIEIAKVGGFKINVQTQ